LLRDADAADDVVQEAMRVAVEKRRAERDAPPRSGGWLAGVVRNVAMHRLRGERRRSGHERAGARKGTVPSAAELVERVEEQRLVLDAVLALEEPYRQTVILRWFEDLSARAIAARQGVPLETVRTRLKRALDRLRVALDERHGGSRRAWCVALAPLAFPRGVPAGPVASVGGGVVVKKLSLVAVLALALGAAAWVLAARVRDRSDAAVDPATASVVDAPTLHAGASPPAPASADTLPPPVDFATIDRDRDLHGVVVRADGTPIAGAHLQVVRYPWRRGGVNTLRYREAEVVEERRSAADGTFSFRLDPGRMVNLRATAESLAGVELDSLQAGERVRVVMPEPVRLKVEVRTSDGPPLASTPVHLFSKANWGLGGQLVDRTESTDASGSARFSDLVPGVGTWIDVLATEDGYAGWTEVTLPREGETSVQIALPKGRTLTGRVVDARTDRPIAGANLAMLWTFSHRVTTDADGRYRMPGWTGKGVSAIHVQAEGYGAEYRVVGEASTIDFALEPGATLVGRVVDASRNPIGGAYVHAQNREGSGPRLGTSLVDGRAGRDGTFRVTSLRADLDVLVAVSADGYATRSIARVAPLGASRPIELGDVVLERPRTIVGTLVDESDRPVARERVSISRADESVALVGERDVAFGSSESRYTDDLGRFRFPEVAPGLHTVDVRLPDWSQQKVEVFVPDDRDPDPVRLRLSATRELRVRVHDAAGHVPEGIGVYVRNVEGSDLSAALDAEGSATFRVTGRAEYVSISLPSPRRWLFPPTVQLTTQKEIEIVLRDALPTSGALRDADGGPLAGFVVHVQYDQAPENSGERTDADGRFRVWMPAGSTGSLLVTGAVLREEQRGRSTAVYSEWKPWVARLDGVRAGSEDNVLRATALERGRALEVRVLDPDGAPASATVEVSPQGVSRETDAAGTVRFEDLYATLSKIRARTRGANRFDSDAVAVIPEGQLLTLRLRRPKVITAVIVDDVSRPVPGARLRVVANGAWIASGDSDDQGRVRLRLDPALESVDLAVTAKASGGRTAWAVVDGVRPDGPELTIRLR
jgi:RNA polymerase sigma-70 factor (ECF subfamily)